MSIDFQIYRLKRQHRVLDNLIEYESGHPAPDPVRISSLKRRRLALKDKLNVLQATDTTH